MLTACCQISRAVWGVASSVVGVAEVDERAGDVEGIAEAPGEVDGVLGAGACGLMVAMVEPSGTEQREPTGWAFARMVVRGSSTAGGGLAVGPGSDHPVSASFREGHGGEELGGQFAALGIAGARAAW